MKEGGQSKTDSSHSNLQLPEDDLSSEKPNNNKSPSKNKEAITKKHFKEDFKKSISETLGLNKSKSQDVIKGNRLNRKNKKHKSET